MGGCLTKSGSENANHEINKNMLQQGQADKSEKKLLLLGSGSSGKSTIFKQLKCIHGKGFDALDVKESIITTRATCVNAMIKLLQKSHDLYEQDHKRYVKCLIDVEQFNQIVPRVSNTDDENDEKDEEDDNILEQHVQTLISFRTTNFANLSFVKDWGEIEELGKAIKFIWSLSAIKETYFHRGKHYSFVENISHFFDKSTEVFSEKYQPTTEDIKCRVRTVGMSQDTYIINNFCFHVFDVGGQRNERKKWIHYFEGVTAVIYVAALNHYDTVLFEEESKNAMHESITLFDNVCNSKWFRKAAMILFLNKNDIFREKLADEITMEYCFSSKSGWNGEVFTGPHYYKNHKKGKEHFEFCVTQAISFIKRQYILKNKIPLKKIFTHITDASNQLNIKQVSWDVQNIVVHQNINKGEF